MFPMTIMIHSDEELALILNAVQGRAVNIAPEQLIGAPLATAAEPEVKKQEKVAPTAETSQSSIGTTSAPSDAVQDSPAPSATGESTGKDYSVDDAKSLTMKIVSSKGRDAAVQLLQKYGVPVAAKLAPDQIAPFCEDAKKVLA